MVALSGLSPGTSYRFEAYANNSAGTRYSEATLFVTMPLFAPPQLNVKFRSGPFDLFAASGIAPGTGVFSGPGVTGSSLDPAALPPGIHEVTFTVTDAFGASSVSVLYVRVAALEPADLHLSKSAKFKPTLVGKRSRPVTLRAANRGEEPLSLRSAGVEGKVAREFRVVGPVARTIPPKKSATIRIVFAPRAKGTRTAKLTVTSTGGTRSAHLSGLGRIELSSSAFPARLLPEVTLPTPPLTPR